MPLVDPSLLDDLEQDWQQVINQWSQTGALTAAAQQALQLEGVPERLGRLAARWSSGDFIDLPTIVLAPAETLGGALGAYASSTGTIYLNANLLTNATRQEVLVVLTEELGHHLDALLNSSDSPGDEGELFSLALNNNQSSAKRQAAWLENDHSMLRIDGQTTGVETAQMPKPYERYTKIAGNGQQGISFIKQEVSINDNSTVAFTGSGFQEDVVVVTGYADLTTTIDADHIFIYDEGQGNIVDISTRSYNATRKNPSYGFVGNNAAGNFFFPIGKDPTRTFDKPKASYFSIDLSTSSLSNGGIQINNAGQALSEG